MPSPGGLAMSAGSNGGASCRLASWAPVLTSKTNAVFVMVNT